MSFFEHAEYDPEIYNVVVENYKKGLKYNIEQLKWGHDENKKQKLLLDSAIECLTIEDFEREVWDLFAKETHKNTVSFIWGPFGLEYRNPRKVQNIYYDGLYFATHKKEFIGCVENQDVSHFFSFLKHSPYNQLNFKLIE